jgi:hypothetical protein
VVEQSSNFPLEAPLRRQRSPTGLRGPVPSLDPNDRSSIFQDTSIEVLRSRGVQFLSCHTAAEEQAHALIAENSLNTSAEEIVKELQSHTVPGVLIVPAMVAAISLLKSEGLQIHHVVKGDGLVRKPKAMPHS